jgi:hypothetical protein
VLLACIAVLQQLPNAMGEMECKRFHGTTDCSTEETDETYDPMVDGLFDYACDVVIPQNVSGFCQCNAPGCLASVNLVEVQPRDCGGETTFTCAEVCKGSVSWAWLIGMACGTVSSAASATGLVLQKWAHHMDSNFPEARRARRCSGWLCSCWWWLGFLLLVVVPLPFNLVAVTLAGMSIMAPFSALPLVFNQLIAPCLLPEKLSRSDIYATAVIVGGVAVTAAFGSHCDTSYSSADLVILYTKIPFTVTWILMVLLTVYSLIVVHARPACLVKGLALAINYAYIAGAFGGLQTVVFKATGELASRWIGEGDMTIFESAELYIFITMTVVLAVGQISYLNTGMSTCDAVKYFPMYQAMLMATSAVLGNIYFEEYKSLTLIGGIMFPLGLSIVMFGVYLLATGSSKAALQVAAEEQESLSVVERGESPDLKTPAKQVRHSNEPRWAMRLSARHVRGLTALLPQVMVPKIVENARHLPASSFERNSPNGLVNGLARVAISRGIAGGKSSAELSYAGGTPKPPSPALIASPAPETPRDTPAPAAVASPAPKGSTPPGGVPALNVTPLSARPASPDMGAPAAVRHAHAQAADGEDALSHTV